MKSIGFNHFGDAPTYPVAVHPTETGYIMLATGLVEHMKDTYGFSYAH